MRTSLSICLRTSFAYATFFFWLPVNGRGLVRRSLIPTYSFADLYACVSKGDKDFFKRNFGGKIVLIGTVLDVEDRKITSKRFATAPEGARAERCALPIPVASQKFARDSIAGVYIHATAVNNLVRTDGLTEFGRIGA